MPTDILMPALSPTMEKGNLAKWLKKEGDKIKSGDVIAEIETDKATMEFEAVDEGTLARIVVPEGSQDIAVNSVIAVLVGEGEDAKSGLASAGQTAQPEQPVMAAAPARQPSALPHAESPAQKPKQPTAASGNSHDANRVFASPLARRMAKEAGIDLAQVQGSGPSGRVVARDIEDAKAGNRLKVPRAAASAVPGFAIAPSMSDQHVRTLYEDGSYEIVPHDSMRRTIAQRLTVSKQTIPHFYLTMDCNIDKLIAAREEINAVVPKGTDGKPAYKLSVNDFVIKALALALQRVPDTNVSWTEAGLLKHMHSDVGVAVAIPNGLFTPIIRKAEMKSISTISREMKDFVTRARVRKLKPHEYQGGTTAVSNLGMYGIKNFNAVINPPHATILAVGAGEERAIVKNGTIEAANIMSVTMSCDHRAVDGALGAELISVFKMLIENPIMMVV
jgi:pyruvate dehydrogenase E2 component (dihydrolipoamide acetyltransferase)